MRYISCFLRWRNLSLQKLCTLYTSIWKHVTNGNEVPTLSTNFYYLRQCFYLLNESLLCIFCSCFESFGSSQIAACFSENVVDVLQPLYGDINLLGMVQILLGGEGNAHGQNLLCYLLEEKIRGTALESSKGNITSIYIWYQNWYFNMK